MVMGILRSEKGQALVEMALALPLLIFLSLGTLEVGRVIHAYLIVNHAAREGARIGSLSAADGEIINRVHDALPLTNESETQIIITPGEGDRQPGESVSVEVRYPLDIYSPVISDFLPEPFIVRSRITMRVE